MNASALLCRVLDERRSAVARAIDLFELQVAMFENKEHRLHARRFAALKLMESIEETTKSAPADGWPILLQDSEYAEAFAVFAKGGWKGLRKLPRDRAFSTRLRRRIRNRKFVAEMIDFFFRFTATNKRKRPSRSLAMKIVRTGVSVGEKKIYGRHSFTSKGTAKARWKDDGQSAIFAYLLLIHRHKLHPFPIHKKSFARQLLAQVNDRGEILRFVANYNAIVRNLRDKGIYDYKRLNIPDATSDLCDVRPTPFEPEVLLAVDEYSSADN